MKALHSGVRVGTWVRIVGHKTPVQVVAIGKGRAYLRVTFPMVRIRPSQVSATTNGDPSRLMP